MLLLDSLKNLLAESDLVLLRCCRPTVALDAHSLHAMASPAPAPAAQPPDPQRLANKIRFETELEVRDRFISLGGENTSRGERER